jgi:hypothetical protein
MLRKIVPRLHDMCLSETQRFHTEECKVFYSVYCVLQVKLTRP